MSVNESVSWEQKEDAQHHTVQIMLAPVCSGEWRFTSPCHLCGIEQAFGSINTAPQLSLLSIILPVVQVCDLAEKTSP